MLWKCNFSHHLSARKIKFKPEIPAEIFHGTPSSALDTQVPSENFVPGSCLKANNIT